MSDQWRPGDARRSLLARGTAAALTAAAALVIGSGPARAETLAGRLTDALTGEPVEEARARVLGTHRTTRTDRRGRWSFELPAGTYEVVFTKKTDGRRLTTRLVNQHVPQYKPGDARLYTDLYHRRGHERASPPGGAPLPNRPRRAGAEIDGPVELPSPAPDPAPDRLTLPDSPPTAIRVARRRDPESGCRNNPIVAIEEMPLESYVKGVLPPEIGVFRNLSNIEETYRAFAVAARSYGLRFRLHFGPQNRRDLGRSVPPDGHSWFHIDDTPCEQRYSDNRLGITDRAVDAVSGTILVDAGDRDLLEKFEYAASCGGHGTRPAFQRSLVPDSPPQSACINNWCGHRDCAGHADNPQVPGDDRCLVRGMCQWGAAGWSAAGRSHDWILDHYQPNLARRTVGGQASRATLEGYVYTDPDDVPGSAIAGAEVTVDGRRTSRTDASGRYRIRGLPTEVVRIEATQPGYRSNSRTERLVADRTNWVSIRLRTAADVADSTDARSADGGSLGRDTSEPTADAIAPPDTPARSDVPPETSPTFGPLVHSSRGVRPAGCSPPLAGRGVPPAIPCWFAFAAAFAAGRRLRRWGRARPPRG